MPDQQQAEDLPGVLFQMVSRARRQAILTALIQQGLGDLGNPMLLFLLEARGKDGQVSSQRELSDALHVSPASVAVSLKSLERGGYVEKHADASDQRRKSVRLTPKGAEAIRQCYQVFSHVDQVMFQGFTQEEMDLFCAYQQRMLRNLRGELPPERMNCQC